MRHHASGLFVLFLVLGSGCMGTAVTGAGAGKLPAIKRDCATCHVSHEGKATVLLKRPLTELCLDCHPGRRGAGEHVVDVVPSMTVAGLPLREGKLSCVTCHDPHNNPYGKLLRMPPAKLCRACHKK